MGKQLKHSTSVEKTVVGQLLDLAEDAIISAEDLLLCLPKECDNKKSVCWFSV